MHTLEMITIQKTTEESIVFTIIELAAQMLKKASNLTSVVGLTPQQWIVLLYIYGDKNIPYADERTSQRGILASDIADALNVSRPNVTNIIRSLCEKGFIFQDKDPKDKRRKVLKLTYKGEEALEQIEPLRRAGNKRLFAKLSVEEKELLLNQILHCLDRVHGRV